MPTLFREIAGAIAVGLRAPLAVRPWDIPLFLQSSRTDLAVAAARGEIGARGAFEMAYTASADPWRSASPRYHYQRRKYEVLVSLLPARRRYGQVLDLGCGLGALARLLAPRAGTVLGLDLSQAAVDRATQASGGFGNLTFRQGDVTALPVELDGCFDLVVVADTLYYLAAPTDAVLDCVADRIGGLLRPGGTLLLAHHYFSRWDAESRLSRRIHDRFIASARLGLVREHHRPFYLVSVLQGAEHAATMAAL